MASKRSIRRKKLTRYKDSLKFGFYCITHPIDGFWDLTHERRGSMAAANTILILTIIARIASLYFTSFIIQVVYWPSINIFLYIASVLLPLALFCIGNWGLTTLFDGKGRLGQIYMATCYAMTPYPLIHFPLILFSQVIVKEEVAFYNLISGFALVWAAFLIVAAMIQIHEYSLSKTLFFMVASLAAMLVIVFILLLFFSMISQGVAYFISIYREISFRM